MLSDNEQVSNDHGRTSCSSVFLFRLCVGSKHIDLKPMQWEKGSLRFLFHNSNYFIGKSYSRDHFVSDSIFLLHMIFAVTGSSSSGQSAEQFCFSFPYSVWAHGQNWSCIYLKKLSHVELWTAWNSSSNICTVLRCWRVWRHWNSWKKWGWR